MSKIFIKAKDKIEKIKVKTVIPFWTVFFGTVINPGTNINPPFTTVEGALATIFKIARWFEIFVAVFGVVYILFGAFTYVTAGGNSENADKGRKYLTYGIVGIVIALSAEGIVRAVASIFGVALPK